MWGSTRNRGGKRNAWNSGEHEVEIDEAQEGTATKYN